MFDINSMLNMLVAVTLGWPFIMFMVLAGVFCTIYYGFVQFRYFIKSWQLALFPAKPAAGSAALSPLQAFINSLNVSLGNGSLAGVATAIFVGGPGSIFWLVIMGLLLMAVRFAEIYLSIYYADKRARIGGPMLYLKRLPGGCYMAYLYAFLALCYALIVGNAIQTNAISISLQTIIKGISPVAIAGFFLLFVGYVMAGGAQRILRISAAIVPFKVGLFFASSLIIIAYHWQSFFAAVNLIISSALCTQAMIGGVAGYCIQGAMRAGILRIIMASEAGLGTSGIFFGATESKQPVEDAILSMLTIFISTLVCLLIGLCIVMSGVWSSGLTSTALTIASFETVFGFWGGLLVTLLSVSFGLGLIVSYAFIIREVWLYVTNNRYEWIGNGLYCLLSAIGALCNARILWDIGDLINAGMILLNIIGILTLSNVIVQGLKNYNLKK